METLNKKKIYGLAVITLLALVGIFSSYSPVVVSFAANSSFMAKLLAWAASFAGGIVAVFLMVSIVKDAVGYAKGNGQVSVFKIIGKVVFMIIMIGIIFLAVNYEKIGNRGQDIANKGLNVVEQSINDSELGK